MAWELTSIATACTPSAFIAAKYCASSIGEGVVWGATSTATFPFQR